jgi:hypothetical protein
MALFLEAQSQVAQTDQATATPFLPSISESSRTNTMQGKQMHLLSLQEAYTIMVGALLQH